MNSPFRVVVFFALFVVTSILCIPHLDVNLLPRSQSNILYVSYSVLNASPEQTEQQATAVLENALSRINGVKSITSFSRHNQGTIELEFANRSDLTMKRFEVLTTIRQLRDKLPKNVGYPIVSPFSSSETSKEASPLLIYTVNADDEGYKMKEVIDEVLRKPILSLEGVENAVSTGALGLQVSVVFDRHKTESYGIDPEDAISSIFSIASPVFPGHTRENEFLLFVKTTNPILSVKEVSGIALPTTNKGHRIRVSDIAKIEIEEEKATQHTRINGKKAVNLGVYVQKGSNSVRVANNIKAFIIEAQKRLPGDYEVRLGYDDTEFIKKEIAKNNRRALLAISVLSFFIMLSYRDWRHLLNLLLSLAVNVSLTILLVWMLGIDIHMYTVSGIAVAFGIMIDHAIIMLDYYRQYRNRNVFMALLAATLTTIAALCLLFLLPDEQRRNLSDFAAVLSVALATSLFTNLFFTVSMFQLLERKNRISSKKTRVQASRIIKMRNRLSQHYSWVVVFFSKFRITFLLLLVMIFGTPIFLLPESLPGQKWYNTTLGSTWYQETAKPWVDKWTGGIWRLFSTYVYEGGHHREVGRTKLYVSAELQHGNTLDQMDEVVSQLENFLASVEGLDMYITTIYSGQYARIEITFKPQYEFSSLPYQLKAQITSRTLDLGGVQWTISGVGQGFSAGHGDETPTFFVKMKGYNYDELEKQANILAGKLLDDPRINHVDIDALLNYNDKPSWEYEFAADFKNVGLLQTNLSRVFASIRHLAEPQGPMGHILMENRSYPIWLRERNSAHYSDWELMHANTSIGNGREIRVSTMGRLALNKKSSTICKEDRQYIRMVTFDYHGSYQFGSNILEKKLYEMEKEIPTGYSAKKEVFSQYPEDSVYQYLLVGLLLIANFVICAILFENLKQPLYIIVTIPVSFIGLLLTFVLFDFPFDQGGYAAFIMLGGLVVNAGIFIVNDFNRLRKRSMNYNKALINATLNRGRTIVLTTIAACCGLVPFLIDGPKEVFWFSFAVGTIGGLFLSMFAVFLVLPVLLWRKE